MRKNYSVINFLICLFFIFLPSLVGYFFYLPEWGNEKMSTWIYYLSSLGFFIYVLLIVYLFIYFRVTNLKLINIAFPFTLILILIFISSSWHIALRIIFAMIFIGLSYPTNILVDFIDKKTSFE